MCLLLHVDDVCCFFFFSEMIMALVHCTGAPRRATPNWWRCCCIGALEWMQPTWAMIFRCIWQQHMGIWRLFKWFVWELGTGLFGEVFKGEHLLVSWDYIWIAVVNRTWWFREEVKVLTRFLCLRKDHYCVHVIQRTHLRLMSLTWLWRKMGLLQ